mgnify:FL=1
MKLRKIILPVVAVVGLGAMLSTAVKKDKIKRENERIVMNQYMENDFEYEDMVQESERPYLYSPTYNIIN